MPYLVFRVDCTYSFCMTGELPGRLEPLPTVFAAREAAVLAGRRFLMEILDVPEDSVFNLSSEIPSGFFNYSFNDDEENTAVVTEISQLEAGEFIAYRVYDRYRTGFVVELLPRGFATADEAKAAVTDGFLPLSQDWEPYQSIGSYDSSLETATADGPDEPLPPADDADPISSDYDFVVVRVPNAG